MSTPDRHACDGSTLLEAIGATALAGVLLASATASMTGTLRTMREQGAFAERLELARSRLEAELGAPCVELLPCPASLVCTLERERVIAPTPNDPSWLVRLRSIVTVFDAAQPAVRLTTLARRSGSCF